MRARSSLYAPLPVWARKDVVCGPRGVVQITEGEFDKLVAYGKIRSHGGVAANSPIVYSVEDTIEAVETDALTQIEADELKKSLEKQSEC